MSTRPFISLETAQVYKQAEAAAGRGDRTSFDDCIRELGSRRRGKDLADELLERWEDLQAPASGITIASEFDSHALSKFRLLTGSECHARLEMMSRATTSVWLSTYTIKDGRGELRRVLEACVRRGVDANLIVSPGPIKPGGHAEEVILDLRDSGVRVAERKNHSKCLVVDSEHVLIGSANLQDFVEYDMGVQFCSRTVASQLIAHLRRVVAQPE